MAEFEAIAAATARVGGAGRARAYVLLVAVTIIGGGNWVVLKTALGQIGPFTFAAWSVAGAAVAMVMLNALLGTLALPARDDAVVVASVGLLQVAAYTLLVFLGLRHVDAGRSAILAFTMPIWVVPGAALFLGERLSRAAVAALALGALGIAVLFNPAALEWSNHVALSSHALLLAAAMAWSISILIVRRRRGQSSALALAPWQLTLAAAALVPAALAVESGQPAAWSPVLIAALAWNALVGTAFGVWATFEATRALPAVATSLGLLGVPVMATVSAVAVLGEPLTHSLILGLGLILAGNAMMTWAEIRQAARQA